MSFTEYRETVDFVWVVARQLDRVMEAYSRVDYDSPALGARQLYMALRALYALTSFLVDSRVSDNITRASSMLRAGEPGKALAYMDKALRGILEELDRQKLLVRKKELMGVVEE